MIYENLRVFEVFVKVIIFCESYLNFLGVK